MNISQGSQLCAWGQLLQEHDLVGRKLFTQCGDGGYRGTIYEVDYRFGGYLAIRLRDVQVRWTGRDWVDVAQDSIHGGLLVPKVPWFDPVVGNDGVIRAFSSTFGGIEIYPKGCNLDESPMSQLLTEEHVQDICRFGHGAETCSYLALGPDGFECLKNVVRGAGKIVRDRRDTGQLKAMGDHCEGRQGTATRKQDLPESVRIE